MRILNLKYDQDAQTFDEAAEGAAKRACEYLDNYFPGADDSDSPGITSNFQGLLADHIRAMLLGKSDANRFSKLPVLARE